MLPRLPIPLAVLLMIAIVLFALLGMNLAVQMLSPWLAMLVGILCAAALIGLGHWAERSEW
jgi:Mg2+ and Co2+ transporter CorA